MKKKLSLKERFHRYMCTLEDRGRWDPIFILYLLWELLRISSLAVITYLFYRFVKAYILWI